jgi:hypothetical protein
MRQRGFSETDLRSMLVSSCALRLDFEDGRFVVEGRRGRERWEVVVEPDHGRRVIWAITAYRVD